VPQVKKKSEKDGYTAVQLGFGEQLERRIKRAELGHLKALEWRSQEEASGVPRGFWGKPPASGQELGVDLFPSELGLM